MIERKRKHEYRKAITVLCIKSEYFELAQAFLPDTGRILRGGRRAYFVFVVPDGTDYVLSDVVDGEALIESKTFASRDLADAWIESDNRSGVLQ